MYKADNESPMITQEERAGRFYTRLRTKIKAWLEERNVSPSVREYLLLLPDLFALVIRLVGDPRVDAALKAQLVIVSTYVISPVDFIPDWVAPLGLVDDTVALAFILTRVIKIMGESGEEVLRAHWEGDGDVLAQIHSVSKSASTVLDERVFNRLRRVFK